MSYSSPEVTVLSWPVVHSLKTINSYALSNFIDVYHSRASLVLVTPFIAGNESSPTLLFFLFFKHAPITF